jgi:serine protease Do
MDEKDNNPFSSSGSFTGGSGNAPGQDPKPAEGAPQQNYGQPQQQYGGEPYLRREIPPEYFEPPKAVRQYDDFMYQPIGFEELEKQQGDASGTEGAPRRTKGERAAVILFALLIAVSALLAIFGIARDVYNSGDAVRRIENAHQVVLYRHSKPAGANDMENFVDENGRYTIEGAAACVIDSVVEIYTYADISHNSFLGSGSGIIISEDGYIVTNAHVLQADGYHTVTTYAGNTYDAKVVGRDVKTDIAVIKINDSKFSNAKLKPAELGNSDETIVGEQVIAVGNPAGLSFSVTDGIVSHIGRKVRGDNDTGFKMECIQTNAQISPGNSGGALVNMYGQVIGITSSKLVSSTLEGLGFAITINEALPIINELIEKGYVDGRFRIGVSLLDMSTASRIAMIEQYLGYSLPEDFRGIYVAKIMDDSDIKNTELKEGDFITEVNGKAVSRYTDFYDVISSQYGAGDTVPATCAHVDKNGVISYYQIKFKLLEDTSGNF